MKLYELFAELQSLGVREAFKYGGRKGGAGPSEGITLFLTKEKIPLNVPCYAEYVKDSPYRLIKDNGKFVLLKNEREINVEVNVPPRPRYYSLKTSRGREMWKVALLHGRDCLGTTLFQTCYYWKKDRGCKFCGVGISLKDGRTVAKKTPDEIYEVCSASKTLDGVRHITITTGTQKNRETEIIELSRAVEAAKKAGLSVHLQIAPVENEALIQKLKESGADTIGIHIESPDEDALKEVSRWKWERINLYFSNWKKAVEIFGRGQVQSFVILGIGERRKKLYDGIRKMCEIGVIPYPVPLRPIPGTVFENRRPPESHYIVEVCERVSEEMEKWGLRIKDFKAGCVRCGACSLLRTFEK